MDGWMDGWMNRWVDGWMDGWPFRVGLSLAHHIHIGPAPGSRLAIAATAERSTAEAQWRTGHLHPHYEEGWLHKSLPAQQLGAEKFLIWSL